ncbi:MAG: glycosyltransferase, partial [Acutalibacteraceae bacterium]
FIDADDRVAPDYIERLIDEAEKSGADIVCCDLIERVGSFDGEIVTDRIHAVKAPRTIDRAEQFYYDYFDKEEYYGYAVWGKIIKRELAVSESFSSLKYGEDLQYMMNLFFHSPKCVLTDYRGYEYIRWSDSATVSAGNLSIKVSTGEVAAAKTLYDHCVKLEDEKLLASAEQLCRLRLFAAVGLYSAEGPGRVSSRSETAQRICRNRAENEAYQLKAQNAAEAVCLQRRALQGSYNADYRR